MALSRADIQRAFQNTLGRAPSPGELDVFFGASQNGTSDTQIYTGISNSQEANLVADPVVRFYQAVFGRVPDAAGLDNASDYIRAFGASAQTYEALAEQFARSPEFQSRYGTASAVDATYVQALYRDILGREPSTAEVAGYVSGANGYDTRGEVLYAIAQSGEAIGRTDAAVNSFLLNAAEGDATYTGSLPGVPSTNPPATDMTPPSVTITLENATPAAGQTTQVTFDFSEAVTGFDLSDVTATRGTLSDFVQSQTDPTLYTAIYTAGQAAGSGTIELTGAYTDTAGNPGRNASTGVTVSPPAGGGGGGGGGGTPPTPNSAPIANADTLSAIDEDSGARRIAATDLLTNDTDANGDRLSIASVASGTGGTAVLNQDGSVTFTPASNFGGTASFQYTVSDGSLASAPVTASFTVTAVNDAPTATGLTQSLTIAEDEGATNLFGSLVTVADIDSASVTATLTLANADAGVLTGATATARPGFYTVTGTPDDVQAALAAVQFDPADNFNGSVDVSVAISDGQTGSQGTNPTGSVAITVTAGNDAPVVGNDTAAAREAGGSSNDVAGINPTGNVLDNDTDTDANDIITVQGVVAGSQTGTTQSQNVETEVVGTYGTLTIAEDGRYTYVVDNTNATVEALNTGSTPLADIFTYTTKDAAGLTSTATLTVSISGANDAPVVTSAASASVPETTTGPVYTVTATDVDTASASLRYAFAGGDDVGLFAIDGTTGAVTFKTAPNYEAPTDTGLDGTYNFNVVATDGAATSVTKAVAVTVLDVNEPVFSITAANASKLEGNSGTTAYTFTVARSGSRDAAATLGYAVTGTGTNAADAADFGGTLPSGSVSFDAGQATTTLTINVRGDTTIEPDESFTVSLQTPPANGTISTDAGWAIGTIQNDENAPTDLNLSNRSIDENRANALVGTLSATDADAGDTLTYSLVQGLDAELFQIVGNELRTGFAGLDYDASATRSVIVRATDANGNFAQNTFQIAVGDRLETHLTLTTGADVLVADAGDALVDGTATTLTANDSLDGGAGTDTLRLSGTGEFRLDTLQGFVGFEQVRLTAVSGSTVLFLRDGTDLTVTASTANEVVFLSTGREVVNGGDGNDYFVARTQAALSGDTLIGGGGSDTLDLDALSWGVTFDLTAATLSGIETLSVDAYTTAIVDTASLSGFSSIHGASNAQVSTAAASLDLSNKSLSNLTVESTNTTGTIFKVNSFSTAATVRGGTGQDTLDASALTLTADQRDALFAASSIETIIDRTGIYGNNGPNVLKGTSAAQTIRGGGGNDLIDGGGGGDTLFGNDGRDTFVFEPGYDGPTTLADFQSANSTGDVVDLRAFGSIRTLADVQARATFDVDGATVDFENGDVLKITGVTEIRDYDFLLAS